jgi:rRNA maturation RNase YbeY
MSGTNNKIHFHFHSPVHILKNRADLKTFLVKLIKKEGKRIQAINFIFCSDSYLLQINKEHLKHDYYTDIITFQLSTFNEPLIADIYISVERVKDNASNYQTTFTKELHRVIFHGLLHLCGYKDKTKQENATMRSKEEHYLKLYFVPRETR